MRIRDLAYKGYANQIPGRHIFRIDERVMSANCFDDESTSLFLLLLLLLLLPLPPYIVRVFISVKTYARC